MTKFYLSFSRYLAVLLVMVSTMAWSQSRTVTGKVTSADDGSGLPGVNVVEKGTSNGTVTDVDGNFSVNVGENATLVFSFVGFASQEVAVGAQSSVNVSLEADVTALSEVVVIGYGEVTKRDATGAVASVKAEEFNRGVISSPEQLIQGKTAGVQITSTSGNPGAGVQLRIRGTNSIRSNNNPLFVVDGVPLSGGTQPSSADVGFGTIADTNPLNFINPSDIESINILKDASATAIYGSRGANGVVIITTKRGKGSKGTFEVASSVSVSSPANKYDLLGREDFLDAVEQFGGDRTAQDAGADTDWQDFVTRTSVSHKQNLSYSRGFQTASVRASLGYEDQQGILENSYMKRLTGKLNLAKSLMNDKLNLDLSLTGSNVNREDPPISGNAGFAGDILGAAYSANPTWPTDPDFNSGGQRSPANMLEYYQSTGTTNRALVNFSADYKLTNAITAKATYGLDLSVGDRVTLLSGLARNGGDGVQDYGQGQLNENRSTSNLFEFTLNHSKSVGKVQIDAVLGYSVQSFRNQWWWATARGFTDFADFDNMESELRDSYAAADEAAAGYYDHYNNWGVADVLINGTQPSGGFVSGIDFEGEGTLEQSYFAKPAGVTVEGIGANFYDQTDYLQSFFGRANFNVSEKYLLTATLRADGSSRFSDALSSKYGFFPSLAAAWKIDQEAFMPDAFSTFKLRAGWGIVGNQDGLPYAAYRRRTRYGDVGVNSSRQIGVPGAFATAAFDSKLKWELTTQTGVGIDFGVIEDRLTGSIDYYVKNTTDVLMRFTAAQPALSNDLFQNLDANVINKGWELSLAYVAVNTDDASLSFSGNISHNDNEVTNLGGGLFSAGTIYGQGLTGAYAQLVADGQPLFSYYLREFEGFDADGQPIGDDQKFVGKTALPTWNVGLSINARYKGFDFATYFTGNYGHYIYNNTRNGFFTAGSINNARNVTRDVLTSGEAGNAEAAVSTRFLEKGDFFRMQNLTLGYTIPTGEAKAIKSFRVYFNAQNLFLITDYSGIDPEVSTSPADFNLLNGLPTAGIDYGAYPRPRTFTLGINAAF